MFEVASRLKYRFDTDKGSLRVEDLWDLPLSSQRGVSLDSIARELYKSIKENDLSISFVTPSTLSNTTLNTKLDIVKHIISVRIAENETANNRKIASEKKRQILDLIANKENEALAGQSIEDLRKLAESL